MERKESKNTSELLEWLAFHCRFLFKLKNHRAAHQNHPIIQTFSLDPHPFSCFYKSNPMEESSHKRTACLLSNHSLCFQPIRMIFSNGSFFAFSFYDSFAPSISTPNTENTSDNSFALANWPRKWRMTYFALNDSNKQPQTRKSAWWDGAKSHRTAERRSRATKASV